jgi:hypothetical protein
MVFVSGSIAGVISVEENGEEPRVEVEERESQAMSADRVSVPSDEPHGEEFANRVIRQVLDLWIIPEVLRRKLASPYALRMAQVISTPTGARTVRLNDEVRIRAKVRDSGNLNVDDPIFLSNVDDVETFDLEEADADCSHITLVVLKSGVHIGWNGTYNRKTIPKVLASADEFLASARGSLHARHWRAFAENLFAAVELMAKASMYSLPDGDLMKSKTHGVIVSKFNQRAKGGRVDPAQPKLLNRLVTMRNSARYATEDFSIEAADATAMMATADAMRAHVEATRPRATT